MNEGAVRLVTIVVPTYQEAENLRLLVPRVADVMKAESLPCEIIVVDDDSGDGTDGVVAGLSEQGLPVRLITRVGERGLSSAVIRGFREAAGEVLICMDADLSHPPEVLPKLLEALYEPGVDFVIGSRYVAGGSTDEAWGLLRWINSKGATLLARPFTRAKDPMAGFFGLRGSSFAGAAQLSPVGYKIGLELIVKCNCRNIREVPIHFANRMIGQSKLNLREQLNYVKHLKRLADFKYGVLSQFTQFCFVGATGMVVDLLSMALLFLLAGKAWPEWKEADVYPFVRAIAIWLAMTWNFALNRRLTFSYSRAGRLFGQYVRFVLSCSGGAAISWSIAVALRRWVPAFEQHGYLAAMVGIIVGLVFNYVFSRFWVFKRTDPERKENSPPGGQVAE